MELGELLEVKPTVAQRYTDEVIATQGTMP
jgi:hypothetical protein